MIIWGMVLAAIGLGWLLDWRILSVVLVALGAVLVFAALSGMGRRAPSWFWCCGPSYPEQGSETTGLKIDEEEVGGPLGSSY